MVVVVKIKVLVTAAPAEPDEVCIATIPTAEAQIMRTITMAAAARVMPGLPLRCSNPVAGIMKFFD